MQIERSCGSIGSWLITAAFYAYFSAYGAAAALPFYPARIRPPGPAALHKKWRGNGLAALMPARIRPPGPAALHKN